MAESVRCKVEKHLTCSVCLKQLKDPKVLPCLHSYCHVCIVNLAKNAKSNTFNCPDCQLAVKVDENTISSLPSNFFVNNLLATMALTKNQPTAKKIFCDNCDSDDAAQSRCNECGMFLCQYCTDSHKRYRSTKHHKLLTMEELKSNRSPQNIAEKIRRCPKHKEEVIKLFCKTCKTTICRDCTIVDHRGHKYGFVEEIAVEEKQHLQSNLDEVKERKSRLVQGIVNLKNFNESLEAKKKSTISEINQHFDELAKTVESGRKEMVEKATSLMNLNQKHIFEQLKILEMAVANCESSIEFTERSFKNGNDIQILSMEKYILQSLEQLKTVKDEMKPCVTEDMMFIISSSVQETKTLLKKCDVVVPIASPDNCKTSFKEEETPLKPGKQYSITVICNDENNRRLKYGGQVIKPSFTGMEVSNVAVTDKKDGLHIISFCLNQGGTLKFEVSINGMPAPNCSLTKQVKFVIHHVPSKGVFVGGGKTKMTSRLSEKEYCYGVGDCYLESGLHTWTIRMSGPGSYYSCKAEVGIIDYDEINATDIANSRKKWVYLFHNVMDSHKVDISLTLNMDRNTLNIREEPSRYNVSRDLGTYTFTARRVSPFFAAGSSKITFDLVE